MRALALERMSISRTAADLGIFRHTANNAILPRTEQTITSNPHRFDGVEVLGVDDSPRALRSRAGAAPSVWRHIKRGGRYVTTPCATAVVPPGFWTWPRSAVIKSSRPGSPSATRTGVGGLRRWRWTALPGIGAPPARSSPRPGQSWTPTRVVSLAGDKLDQYRRGRASDRLYQARRTLRTGAGPFADTKTRRFEALFANERHAPDQAAWCVYKRLIQTYRSKDPG